MATIDSGSKKYKVDRHGFLLDPADWDEEFAELMAPKVRIKGGLTEEHWKIIHFVRNQFAQMKVCPLIYAAARNNGFGLGRLRELFPTGYLRGVCKLAGITYRDGTIQHYWLEENRDRHEYAFAKKTYHIDCLGFLVDPAEWDENFALMKAYEMKMPHSLTDRHWAVIRFLRDRFAASGEIPNIYETCEENSIDLELMEELFPDGYHRGAVKLAGLRDT